MLFRILLNKPELANSLANEKDVVEYLLKNFHNEHLDTLVKILAAATASKDFAKTLPLDVLAKELLANLKNYLNDEKIDERVGNFTLTVSRIIGHLPETSLAFTDSIPLLVNVVKDKTGPVRKNVAVCLGKMCNNEKNKEVLRDVHGLEVLNSIMGFINK